MIATTVQIKRAINCYEPGFATKSIHLIGHNTLREEVVTNSVFYEKNSLEKGASNNSSIDECVFISAVKFLSSRCIATMVRCTYVHIDRWE